MLMSELFGDWIEVKQSNKAVIKAESHVSSYTELPVLSRGGKSTHSLKINK